MTDRNYAGVGFITGDLEGITGLLVEKEEEADVSLS